MGKYLIADTVFEFRTKYEYTRNLCKDYVCNDDAITDYSFSVTDEEIDYERSLNTDCSIEYAESLAIYRKILSYILQHKNGLFLHCAAIVYNDKAFLFLAKSGVGKTTHISLWKKCFKNSVKIINGDKPIIRMIGNDFYVYGTPWRGKEKLGKNVSCKIYGCAFIERAKDNSVVKASADYFIKKIFEQIVRPKKADEAEVTLELLEKFYKNVPFYVIRCNTDKESAIIAKNAMDG